MTENEVQDFLHSMMEGAGDELVRTIYNLAGGAESPSWNQPIMRDALEAIDRWRNAVSLWHGGPRSLWYDPASAETRRARISRRGYNDAQTHHHATQA